MKILLKYIFFACIFLFPWNDSFSLEPIVIPQTKDIRPEAIGDELVNTTPLTRQIEIFIRRYEYFNRKYPGDAIDNDMMADIEAAYPHLTRQEMFDKEDSIRFAVKSYRTLVNWYDKIKEKMLVPEPPPLIVDEDEYDSPYTADYIESENLIIIPDFKKVIGYGMNKRDFEAMELRARRQAVKDKRIPESLQKLNGLFGQLDWKKLFFYGIVYDDPFSGRKGLGEWDRKENVRVRLISAPTTVSAEPMRAAVHIGLTPGNAILWSPQKKIEPPVFDFSGSENLASAEVILPMPVRIWDKTEDNLTGYTGDFAVPVLLKAEDASKPMTVRAKVSFSLCRNKECSRLDFTPELTLQPGENTIGSGVESFVNKSFGMLPEKENDNFRISKAVVDSPIDENEGQSMRLVFTAEKNPDNFDVFVEGEGSEVFFRPRVTVDGKVITARFPTAKGSGDIVGKTFQVTASLNELNAIRQNVTLKKASVFDIVGPQLSLGLLLLAVLGGLILNFMPCVFPVLSLKFLSLTRFGAADNNKIRRGFALTVAGIFAAFALLILLLLVLKASGRAIGWGMQFQNPYFLVCMMFVMALFMAQIMGTINIQTPRFLLKYLNDGQNRQDDFLHFLTGLFLVLVSTPCTAPYLGTTIGFALAGSSIDIIAVLLAVALGLSLPYIFLAAYPDGAAFMPKPGAWMRHLERFMILMLILTLIWMGSVLSAQAGVGVSVKIAACLLVFLAVLWFRKIMLNAVEGVKVVDEAKELSVEIIKSLAFTIAALLFAASLIMAQNGFNSRRQEMAAASDTEIEMAEINRALKAGEAVVVKVGADWCLTCKYNDFTVFNNPMTEEVLQYHKVKIINVDWTNYNAEVLAFMKRYGRSGLPFYILFSRKYPDGIVLPEILDETEFNRILKNFIN